MNRSSLIATLTARYDQDLAAAQSWWNNASREDRRNLLIVLCSDRLDVSVIRGLNDAGLKVLRDLAALAVANLTIGSEDVVI